MTKQHGVRFAAVTMIAMALIVRGVLEVMECVHLEVGELVRSGLMPTKKGWTLAMHGDMVKLCKIDEVRSVQLKHGLQRQVVICDVERGGLHRGGST